MPSNPDVYPYNAIAFITATIGSQRWQGSGVLIAPDEVLTASHIVYNSALGGATDISVSFGYDQGNVGIGSATGISFHNNPIQDADNKLTTQQTQIDYAVIHLSRPFTAIAPMALQPNFPGGAANVSGYPAVQGGQLTTSSQTLALFPGFTVLDGISLGPGSSGGPVWTIATNGVPYVVGIVSTEAGGPGSDGYFTQVSTAAFNQIETWLALDDGAASTLSVHDTSAAQAITPTTTPYAGPVAGLVNQYINLTTNSLALTATSPGWFIHTGSGTDAIAAAGGTNVLDAGTGSNFLSGGTGTDTFFLDDRGATADIWDSIANFHAGDVATVWGVTQAGFALAWADNQGAPSFQGLTLHIAAAGSSNAALTLAGFSQSDLQNGRLSVSFGTDAASGSPFLYLAANT